MKAEETTGRDRDAGACSCGTCDDAFDAAMKTYAQMRANNCAIWNARIAAAMRVFATYEAGARAAVLSGEPMIGEDRLWGIGEQSYALINTFMTPVFDARYQEFLRTLGQQIDGVMSEGPLTKQ